MSDTTPREEPWTPEIEQYLSSQIELCGMLSEVHNESGRRYEMFHIVCGLPTIIVPSIMAPISLMIGWTYNDTCEGITPADYVNASMYAITAVFAGVFGFFNFGEKSAKHFSTSLRYGNIVSDIRFEMTRGKKFRVPADVFVTKINLSVEGIHREAPVIPFGALKSLDLRKSDITSSSKRAIDSFAKVLNSKSDQKENAHDSDTPLDSTGKLPVVIHDT